MGDRTGMSATHMTGRLAVLIGDMDERRKLGNVRRLADGLCSAAVDGTANIGFGTGSLEHAQRGDAPIDHSTDCCFELGVRDVRSLAGDRKPMPFGSEVLDAMLADGRATNEGADPPHSHHEVAVVASEAHRRIIGHNPHRGCVGGQEDSASRKHQLCLSMISRHNEAWA